MTKAVKKRRGRPPIAKETRKARNVTFRTRDELHRDLSTAAEASGRSLSEEIEYRLERSLTSKRMLREALEITYGPAITALMFAIGEIVRPVTGTDDRWIEDVETYQRVWSTVHGIMTAFRPSLDCKLPESSLESGSAQFWLYMLRDRVEPSERDRILRDLFAPLLDKMKFAKRMHDGTTVFE